MARRYIGMTDDGPRSFRNIRVGHDGNPLILMEEGEVTELQIDYGPLLETGVTLSSVTTVADSVTAATNAAGAIATITLSEPQLYFGEIVVTAILSNAERVVMTAAVRRVDRHGSQAVWSGYSA